MYRCYAHERPDGVRCVCIDRCRVSLRYYAQSDTGGLSEGNTIACIMISFAGNITHVDHQCCVVSICIVHRVSRSSFVPLHVLHAVMLRPTSPARILATISCAFLCTSSIVADASICRDSVMYSICKAMSSYRCNLALLAVVLDHRHGLLFIDT